MRLLRSLRRATLAAVLLPVLWPASTRAQAQENLPQGTIRAIECAGLRRLRPDSLRAHIVSAVGQPLDPARVESDVRALGRLGWFDW